MRSIQIREKDFHKKLLVLIFIVAFTLFIMPSQLHAAPVTFDKTLTWKIYDLSQHTIIPQAAYCAPTAATNALWAFYENGDNSLIQPAASLIPEDMADNTISLLATAYMLADPVAGTSTAFMVSGLQSYADDHGTSKYKVSLLTAFNTGNPGDGHTLWEAMMDELSECEEVLVIIKFDPTPPVSHAEVEDLNLDFDGSEFPPIGKQGHAVTMTGYDNTAFPTPIININDPANNLAHVWSPESAPMDLDVFFPNSILINTPPYAGFLIIGAVTMSTVGVTVSAISGDTDEGGTTATFTVVLTSQPTADVTIPITSLDLTEGTVSPASLTFTNADWNTAQTVTVTGVDDALIDGDITYTVEVGDPASADTYYDALTNSDTADVSVTNLDDDTDSDGVTVSAISGDTDESGTAATFTVVLTSQPTADVTIPITSLDLTEGTVSAANLTFTNANWNSAQTVTVTGVDDALVDGDITYTVEVGDPASADTDYDALTNADTADVSVTNLDDDTDSDDGGGCFIVTTADGSPIEPYVNILRDYLNRILFNH